MAPERSPRSGNVASTRECDSRRQGQPSQSPSRYLELSAIACTSEHPSGRKATRRSARIWHVTLLTCVQTVTTVHAQAELLFFLLARLHRIDLPLDELLESRFEVECVANSWIIQRPLPPRDHLSRQGWYGLIEKLKLFLVFEILQSLVHAHQVQPRIE